MRPCVSSIKRPAALASSVKPILSPPVCRYWPGMEPEMLSMKPVHAGGSGGGGFWNDGCCSGVDHNDCCDCQGLGANICCDDTVDICD
jgi:hypothetical protein